METKILITGSNGLLGQKLSDLYLEAGADFVATSTGENRHPMSANMQYIPLDITSKGDLSRVLENVKPTIIINTAAMTNVDVCESEPEKCKALNVTAVKNIAAWAKKNDAFVLHLGTDFIFDGENGPYSEDDEPNPLSLYGQSKLDSENALKESGCKFAVARTILVYGLVANMSRSNIVLWAKSMLEQGKEITIVNDQFRSPTLAEDLAKGCYLIGEGKYEGIFNISGKEVKSVYSLVQEIADVYGLDKSLIKPISTGTLSQAAPRPPKTGFNIAKAERILGYQPHSLSEGLVLLKKQLE